MRAFIFIIVALLVCYVCYSFGADIPFAKQWTLYEGLRTTSSIVFGVMGIWIAVVFPTSLTKIYDKTYQYKKEELGKIIRLFKPLVISMFILGAVLVLGILAPILQQLDFVKNRAEIARSISFCVLGVMTLMQLWTLVASLAPGETLIYETKNALDRSGLLDRLKSQIKK